MKKINICIIGGKLQGTEACYLAKEAGWEITLIDKNNNCSAASLADNFYCADILSEDITEYIKKCDIILPALENKSVINKTARLAKLNGIPFIYDENAYKISSSKLRSDRMFEQNGISAPKYYPNGSFPYIIKPSVSSGSEGVRKVYNEIELQAILKGKNKANYVIQQYINGPSYSIEVVGDGTNFYPLQITEIITDSKYDCCRVEAGFDLSENQKNQMYELGVKIGKLLKIKGIFDIETILSDGKMYVLEIDARLPSQTPTAVYKSCKINMLELLYDAYCGQLKAPKINISYYAVYQHILVENGRINILGEHIMGNRGRLRYVKGFFGCDEAITDYRPHKKAWTATLIVCESTREEAVKRLGKIIHNIEEGGSLRYETDCIVNKNRRIVQPCRKISDSYVRA